MQRSSVFGRQQNGRGRSIARIIDRFRDGPELVAQGRAVGGQQAGAVDQGLIVRLLIFLAHFAPIARDVPLDELDGRLTGLLERFEGTGGDEQLAEEELRLRLGDHRGNLLNADDSGCPMSERNDLVLDHFALLNAINRLESGHLPVETHPAQAVELADEGQSGRVVDEIIAADTAPMQSEQVPVKTADNGDQIAGILHGVGVGCGFLLDRIGTAGDGGCFRHCWLLGIGWCEEPLGVL